MKRPQLKLFGERALLLEWPQKISEIQHQEILTCQANILANPPQGFETCIPSYNSLTLIFKPEMRHLFSLKSYLKTKEITATTHRQIHLPVCYEMALDLAELSVTLQLSPKEIIATHCSVDYYVYLVGFLPGFPYMGELPEKLWCSRKTNPRTQVPSQSVAIAGKQTGIYPSSAPGGWQCIGKTPFALFNYRKPSPFLFQTGDRVRFHSIKSSEYHKLTKDLLHNQSTWKLYEY